MKITKNAFEYLGYFEPINELRELALEEDFSRSSVREDGTAHQDTRILLGLYDVLENIDGIGDKAFMKKYGHFIFPVINAVKKKYGYDMCEIKSLCLIKLLANGIIDEHIDNMGIYPYSHRVHVPVQTNEDCIFTVNSVELHMPQGSIFELDNVVPHSVVNGDEDRIHLMMDIVGVHENCNVNTILNGLPEEFYKD
jgi:hypothetical protein